MNYTPKVILKKSSFGGVFIMKLTDKNKVQIYALRKHGKTSNDPHNYFIENGQGNLQFPVFKPSRLPKDIALFNNSCLCISRIYAVFKELINL